MPHSKVLDFLLHTDSLPEWTPPSMICVPAPPTFIYFFNPELSLKFLTIFCCCYCSTSNLLSPFECIKSQAPYIQRQIPTFPFKLAAAQGIYFSVVQLVSMGIISVSNSLRPHGLQPARFLSPWDSPSNNTGVGCHSLLQGIFPTWGSNPRL